MAVVKLKVKLEVEVEDSANLERPAETGTQLANSNMMMLRFQTEEEEEDLVDKLQMDQNTILQNQTAKIGQITNFAVELNADTATTFQALKTSPQTCKSMSAWTNLWACQNKTTINLTKKSSVALKVFLVETSPSLLWLATKTRYKTSCWPAMFQLVRTVQNSTLSTDFKFNKFTKFFVLTTSLTQFSWRNKMLMDRVSLKQCFHKVLSFQTKMIRRLPELKQWASLLSMECSLWS